MEKFQICGGKRLSGEVEISGAKNAAVAILPATVLVDGVCRLENIPNISDVSTTLKILKSLGSQIRYIKIPLKSIVLENTPYPTILARHMRRHYFIGACSGASGLGFSREMHWSSSHRPAS